MSRLQQRRQLLRQLYGFDFPDDFYRFWDFACQLRPLEPLRALEEPLGIVLTGPFEVLWGRFDRVTPPSSVYLHWRYYNDPPEFFTVLVGGGDGHHWGYFLDDPARGASYCIASYYADDAYDFGVDDNLFEAVRLYLEEGLAEYEQDIAYGLQEAGTLDEARATAREVRQVLQRFATGERTAIGAEYVDLYAGGELSRQPTAATHDGLGIVVPAPLYRSPSQSDKALWKRLCQEDDPQDVVEEARGALAEGFPGTTLKLARDLWATGGEQHQAYAFDLLDAAYVALGRDLLRQVLTVHRQQRDRPWLDVLEQEA